MITLYIVLNIILNFKIQMWVLPKGNTFIFLQAAIHCGDLHCLVSNEGNLHFTQTTLLSWGVHPEVDFIYGYMVSDISLRTTEIIHSFVILFNMARTENGFLTNILAQH